MPGAARPIAPGCLDFLDGMQLPRSQGRKAVGPPGMEPFLLAVSVVSHHLCIQEVNERFSLKHTYLLMP